MRDKITGLMEHRVVRYFLVGGSAYVIEIGCLVILHKVLGLSPVSSVAISFWIGFITAFTLQKLVTFKDFSRDKRAITRQIAGYSVLVAFNYAFTLMAVTILSDRFSVFIIRTAIIIIVTSWNFVIYRRLFNS
jgi:putative flippase GtrA